MIKLIDLYILKRFIGRILFLLIAISSIILITNLVEMIDNFIDANMKSNEIFNYYLYTLPMIISYALPMAITIATVLSILVYIQNNELLAIRSLGINYFRLTRSIIFFSILISVFHFYFENTIVSNSNRLKNKIVKKYNLDKKNNKNKKNNFIEDISKNQSILINSYNNKNQTANKIVLKEIDDKNNLISRIDADKMVWKNNNWYFEELLYRNWKNNQYTFKIIKDTSIMLQDINPIYLTTEFIEPDQMNYFELKKFVDIKKKNSGNINKLAVGLHHKLSYALSSLVLTISAIILSVALKNSNVSYGIGLSLLIITIYYVMLIIGKNFGIEGILSPLLSAWLSNITVLLIAFYSYKRFVF